jgi:hypothetical protein
MGRIRAIYQDAGNGKGAGMFAPCDIAPGELVFAEVGFEFPLEEYCRPWKAESDFETKVQFGNGLQKIHNHMHFIKSCTMDNAGSIHGTLSGLNYPSDVEACFMRPVNHNAYSMGTMCEAMFDWMPTQIPMDQQRYSAAMVARFLEDCFPYVKYGSSTEVVSVFGLLTGLVNHACSPNAILQIQNLQEQRDDEPPQLVVLNVTACKEIKKGDEITFSYTWDVSPGVREHHAKLLRDYEFNCRCDSCIEEAKAYFLFKARDAVYELLHESKQNRESQTMLPLKLTCNMARWIIDGSEELGYFNIEILEALDTCARYNADLGDHLRASYFCRVKIEMIRTYMSSDNPIFINAEKRFNDTYTEWNAPEVCELSKRLYKIDDKDVVDKLYMMSPNVNDHVFTKKEKNSDFQEIVLAFRKINKTVQSTREAQEKERVERALEAANAVHDQNTENSANEDTSSLQILANVAIELAAAAAEKQLKTSTESNEAALTKQERRAIKVAEEEARVAAAKKKKRKSAGARARRVQHRKFSNDGFPIESSDEEHDDASPKTPGESFASGDEEILGDDVIEHAAFENEEAASTSTPPAGIPHSLAKYAYSGPWLSPFAAKDGLSKQTWFSSQLLQDLMPFAPRDVEHLLAAKDGLGSKSEGFGLKMRRDSGCGRVEGMKEFLDLVEVFGGRKRAHSFGNDAGKKDLLKEAEV